MEGGGFGGGGGWGENHRHTARWGFGGWFCSCVDTLVVCTSLPLINIGAFLTVCIQNTGAAATQCVTPRGVRQFGGL